MFNFRSGIIFAIFSFLLSGCAMISERGKISHSNIQRQKFVSTISYCRGCYVIFGDSKDIKTFSTLYKCPKSRLISLNPHFSSSTVIHDGEVIVLPEECKNNRFSGLVVQQVTSSLNINDSDNSEFKTPLILNNNHCILSIADNKYSKKFIPLFFPTTHKPISFKKDNAGGALIITSPKDKVVSAAAGQVVMSSSSLKKYGNLIVVRHGYNYATVYAHLGKNIVQKGDNVQVGQAIALPLCDGIDCSFTFSTRFKGHILPLHFGLKIFTDNNIKAKKDVEAKKDIEAKKKLAPPVGHKHLNTKKNNTNVLNKKYDKGTTYALELKKMNRSATRFSHTHHKSHTVVKSASH